VEYELAGINQVQINEKAGLTFPFILRAILRQDPDVIMIGEIRDFETAEIAVQASLTGHLVLSTLHTNDAASAITRLLDIGIPPYMITSTVVGVVAQRLVRKICTDCKEPYTPNPEMLSLLNVSHQDAPSRFYRGTGCAQCNNTGFKGRTVIEEIMTMGHKVRDLVLSGD
jgi:type IV pilus assembly protein PilB